MPNPSSNNTATQASNANKLIRVFSHATQAGTSLFGPKTNQDNFIMKEYLNGKQDRYFFAICDGHGVNGHLVSSFIKTTLPNKLELNLSKFSDQIDDEYIVNTLNLTFLQMSKALLDSNIDCTFSGSTTTAVLIIGNKVWCANLGDSRTVIAKGYNGDFTPYPLSADQKPDVPMEMERILMRGGRCYPYRDADGNQIGPYRVWLQDEDIPGLAMSRSFGDLVATQVGVICEPEIR